MTTLLNETVCSFFPNKRNCAFVGEPWFFNNHQVQLDVLRLCDAGYAARINTSTHEGPFVRNVRELMMDYFPGYHPGCDYDFLTNTLLVGIRNGEYLLTRSWFCRSLARHVCVFLIKLNGYSSFINPIIGDFDDHIDHIMHFVMVEEGMIVSPTSGSDEVAMNLENGNYNYGNNDYTFEDVDNYDCARYENAYYYANIDNAEDDYADGDYTDGDNVAGADVYYAAGADDVSEADYDEAVAAALDYADGAAAAGTADVSDAIAAALDYADGAAAAGTVGVVAILVKENGEIIHFDAVSLQQFLQTNRDEVQVVVGVDNTYDEAGLQRFLQPTAVEVAVVTSDNTPDDYDDNEDYDDTSNATFIPFASAQEEQDFWDNSYRLSEGFRTETERAYIQRREEMHQLLLEEQAEAQRVLAAITQRIEYSQSILDALHSFPQ